MIWRVRGRSAFRAFNPPRGAPGATKPSRAHIGPITVSFISGNPAEPPRVAYAIGRKVGDAVERNRIRRQLRTVIRDLASQLRPGMYLMGVSPHSTPLRSGELRTIVMRALDAIWTEETKRRSPRPPAQDDTVTTVPAS